MKLSELMSISEFQLISKLKKLFPKTISSGIGDDCAVVFRDGIYELFSTDCMVEGVHFTLSENDPYWIGWKLVAVNVSDIAAMGGTPKGILLSWAIPANFDEIKLDLLAKGIADCAKTYGVEVMGGDTSKSLRDLFLNVAIWGQMTKPPIYRSGAKDNDSIFVTGKLGGSILGRHLKVQPRVKEMQWLADFGINAALDISDGLLGDLGHIAEESKLFFEIDEVKIPIHDDAKSLSFQSGKPALFHALNDGEDFEIVFTVSTEKVNSLLKSWPFDNCLYLIGNMSKDQPNRIQNRLGQKVKVEGKSFEHQF